MWTLIRHYRSLINHPTICRQLKRLFMSNSFSCEEVWSKRMKSPILQKVSLEDMFYELDNKFSLTKKASAIDIDIFVNAVNNGEHIDEMEDLVHRLRMSSEAANILDSTHHGFIRNYLAYGDADELMRILNDRLNYGIFPDNFCSILLMDHFIKTGDFKNAAKVATLHMLQEDFSNDIITYLSLFSCHKYLLNPTEWEEKVEAEPESDEEVRVRVKYVRNPFFDDHFDLREPNKLIGKTFSMISYVVSDSVGDSYKLLGLVLSSKFKEAEDHIQHCLNSGKPVYHCVIKLVKDYLDKMSDKENIDTDINNFKRGLDLLSEQPQCINEDLLVVLEKKIIELISANEKSIIQAQTQVYEEWENNRETVLRNELEELNKAETLEEIQKKKQDLLRKEQELFFFEKENELELAIDSKKVRYPPKWLGKKKKKRSTDDVYVPPEITKQKSKPL